MSTTNSPAASVLLITYNHEKYVRQALDSVLMQKADFAFEVVAADDCSQDSTPDILREYQANNPAIRVLPTERHLGITRNYKRGFDACRGEYVAVIEGDDYWISPRKLEALCAFLREHPECPFCFHRVIRLDEGSEHSAVYPKFTADAQSNPLTASLLARENFIGGFSTCVYRRAAVAALDPTLWGMRVREWLFNIVVAQQGTIGYVPEIMSVYRAHPGGLSSQKTPAEQAPELLELVEAYNKYLGFKFDEEFTDFKLRLRACLRESDAATAAADSAYRRLARLIRPFVPQVILTLVGAIHGRDANPPRVW